MSCSWYYLSLSSTSHIASCRNVAMQGIALCEHEDNYAATFKQPKLC